MPLLLGQLGFPQEGIPLASREILPGAVGAMCKPMPEEGSREGGGAT